MSDIDTISIPSLTEGKEPYQVKIPIIKPYHHRKMLAYEAIGEIDKAADALAGSDELVEDAISREEDLVDLIDAIKQSGMEDAGVVIAERTAELKKISTSIRRLGAKRDNLKKEYERAVKRIKKCFGELPKYEIGEHEVTYLLYGKKILGEPWAVAVCCDLPPDLWEDIDYPDYKKICYSLFRRNAFNDSFLELRHPETVAKMSKKLDL